VAALAPLAIPDAVRRTGTELARSVPSTGGTLVAFAFMAAGRALAAADPADAADPVHAASLAVVAAATSLAERGKVAVGDKTMLDALDPAARALAAAADAGSRLAAALRAAADAADAGASATTGMRATVGRAGWLADRSQGHEDAGARLVALAFASAAGRAAAAGAAPTTSHAGHPGADPGARRGGPVGHEGGHPGGDAAGHPGGDASDTASPAAFDRIYEGTPSWDLGRPQPAVIRATEAGFLAGSILDLGCGTGEDARWLADRGHAVVGVDFSTRGMERARAGRATAARFAVADVRDLAAAGFGPEGRTFDTALDVGCFHSLRPVDRAVYAVSVRGALRPGGRLVLLCWSDRNEFAGGPARMSTDEIRAAFTEGWTVESIEPDTLESPRAPGSVLAWLAIVRRADGAIES
jgi:SAM-dependent methyltransferase